MLPQVPQTRRWPAVRTELPLKSDPTTHSCAAQLSGGVLAVRAVRGQQARAGVRGASLSWAPAWPMRPQEPLIRALTADNTLATAMIDRLMPLLRFTESPHQRTASAVYCYSSVAISRINVSIETSDAARSILATRGWLVLSNAPSSFCDKWTASRCCRIANASLTRISGS